MQSINPASAFPKLQQILDTLEQGDSKSAAKIYAGVVEKSFKKPSKDPYMKILTQIVKATVLSAGGKKRIAEEDIQSAFKDLLEASADPKNIKLRELMDLFAQTRVLLTAMGVQEGYFTLASNPYYKQFADVVNQINSKVKNEELCRYAHNISLHTNKFNQFGSLASKLGGAFGHAKEFSLNSVEAFYLQGQQEGAAPSMNQMAEMFSGKY